MANGPFDSYAPPGVYTQTNVRQDASGPPVGTRIAMLVGTGQEVLSQVDFELVRGSSSSVDQRINNEDVNERFVLDNSNPNNPILGAKDGSQARFQVRNFPIVTGDGQGITTTSTASITVTVDGELVSPASVDGARGVVTLQVAPPEDADVRITYFFNRTDTKFTDDLSTQVTVEPAILYTEPGPFTIVGGENVLSLKVDGVIVNLSLGTGVGRTANQISGDINGALVSGLTATVDTNNLGQERVQLVAQGSLEILSGSVNVAIGVYAGQKTARNKDFFVYHAPIVTGNNGGITTTNPADVKVFVDGSQVVPSDVDGINGVVTLSEPPKVGSEVVVEYYHNTWQDTFDYLPNTGITSVQRVGISPGRTDYIEGSDYVIDPSGRILWGAAATVESGQHTAGTEFFDDTQITASLVDNRMYLEEVPRFVDRSTTPATTSNRTVVLSMTPTTGNGRDTELNSSLFNQIVNGRISVGTHRPDLVKVYHGSNPSEAVANGPVAVMDVDPVTRRVTVKDPIPPDHKVWATYYYNRLQDDELTFKVLSAGPNGTYSVFSSLLNTNLKGVTFGSKSNTTFTVTWATGSETNPDAFVTGASGVNEVVTVTFEDVMATPAVFTNMSTGPFDIYTGFSDNLAMDLSGDTVVADLTLPGYGVLVSEQDSDSLYDIILGTNDEFKFTLNGVSYARTLTAGVGVAGATIASEVNLEVPAVIEGTGSETFDLDTISFEFTMNGTVVTIADFTLDGMTAADVAMAINAEIGLTALTSGDPRDGVSDGRAVAVDGKVVLEASTSLLIGTEAGNAVLGFTNGDSETHIPVMRFESGRFLLRSQVLPSSPDDVSTIRVEDGTANSTLGFTNWVSASGVESAVNKAATLLSNTISAAALTNLVSTASVFVVAVNGTEYNVGPFLTANHAAVATAIDTALGAAGTAVVVDNKIRITSASDANTSRVEIRSGSANTYLGFTNGQVATQRKVTVAEMISVLNTPANWTAPVAGEFAYTAFADSVNGYLRVTTFGLGTLESILFEDDATSALNDTNIGIKVGDGATGVDAIGGFAVTSDNANGSSGSGIVGQTYTDARTGLRFSLLGDSYPAGDSFTLVVNDTFTSGASNVVKAVAGTEIFVFNTTDVGVDDTAVVRTFDKTGSEPGIGDFYYISYEYEKTDFSARLFTRFRDIQANYGALSSDNPLTLAAYLSILNGAVIVGCKQVLKQSSGANATPASYISALAELARPLPGGVTPDILVPLSADPDVMGAYVQHAEIQSSMRLRQERRCVFGVASGTRPEDASAIARGLQSERAILLYPDSAIMSLNDELGNDISFLVDGTYLAAALAGSLVSPQFDVASPLTRRNIVGLVRLNRTMDETEKNQLASSGVTVLEDRGTSIQVRDGLTTDVRNRFTATPSIVAIKDFVQQQTRATLDRFIGLKFLKSRQQDVEIATNGLLKRLVQAQIIAGYQPATAEPDPQDPTSLRVTAFYAPVFPLKYIPVTYTISSSASL